MLRKRTSPCKRHADQYHSNLTKQRMVQHGTWCDLLFAAGATAFESNCIQGTKIRRSQAYIPRAQLQTLKP